MDPETEESAASGSLEDAGQVTETVVVALRNDDIGVQALKWALNLYGRRTDGKPVIFMLLHIVSDVPNAQMKLVRVSEADVERVAVHLRDRVLPFLENMQDLCDLNEVMSSIEVVKDDLRPEAIVDSAARLQADTLILGGSDNTTTWGTIAHCTAPGKSPKGCRVIVVTNGQKSKEVSADGELVPLKPNGGAKPEPTPAPRSGTLQAAVAAESGDSTTSLLPPAREGGFRGVSLFSGKKRSKKRPLNQKVLVKQRSEERGIRDEDSLHRSGVVFPSHENTSPVRFAASLFSQLSIGRKEQKPPPGVSPERGAQPAKFRSISMDKKSGRPPTHPPPHGTKENLQHAHHPRGVPRGRVTLYTEAGSEACKQVKALLKSKHSAFVEISLDIYPERRKEMEMKSHKTSVPQVFFNGFHVGDGDSLVSLEQQGELDAMIEDVYDTDPPDNAPVPPGLQKGGRGDPLEELPDDPHSALMKRMRKGVAVQDRLYAFTLYSNCFVGSDAIGWLCRDQQISTDEALILGNVLLSKRFFHHVHKEHPLEDNFLFYKFIEDTSSITGHECLNYWEAVWPKEQREPAVILHQLARMLQAIYEEFVTEDGRLIDYAGIAQSDAFKRYLKRTEELHRISLHDLSREERLALFLNIHNMMLIHIVGGLGVNLENQSEMLKSFRKYTYLIGGSVYSTVEIQNGILRGNRKPPNAFAKPFAARDTRAKYALECEPLIHFGLISGTQGGAILRAFYPDTVMDTLRENVRQHFAQPGGLRIDVKARQIHLNKLFSWFGSDFGKTPYEVLVWIGAYVDEQKRTELMQAVRDMATIVYQDYDWTPNNIRRGHHHMPR
eukprot:TRINITY_DN5644_c0_g1_i2.p1 TRINITY_DN5644_c0_g1~~TRINITY_DN5644_c0_g1_i2.p1  ORF type:complete len:856 (+),score=138.48 TRINITY_DN5644_c0_g1_i2:61-2568(+)